MVTNPANLRQSSSWAKIFHKQPKDSLFPIIYNQVVKVLRQKANLRPFNQDNNQ